MSDSEENPFLELEDEFNFNDDAKAVKLVQNLDTEQDKQSSTVDNLNFESDDGYHGSDENNVKLDHSSAHTDSEEGGGAAGEESCVSDDEAAVVDAEIDAMTDEQLDAALRSVESAQFKINKSLPRVVLQDESSLNAFRLKQEQARQLTDKKILGGVKRMCSEQLQRQSMKLKARRK